MGIILNPKVITNVKHIIELVLIVPLLSSLITVVNVRKNLQRG